MRSDVKVIRNGTGSLIVYVNADVFDIITEATGPCADPQAITLSADEVERLMDFFVKYRKNAQ